MLRLSETVRKSIDEAIASAGAVVDVVHLSKSVLEQHPDLRFDMDELVEIVVARVTEQGRAVRFEG